MNLKKIKRAIISVSDKSNLKLILPTLKKFNIEIISSGGTFKKIKSMKYNCIDISNYTGFPEMLDGRIKTLHPKIHAGILNIRKNKKHKKNLERQKIPDIDLVIVDLYPFEKKFEEKINTKKEIKRSIFAKFRNYFITGIVVLVPIGITLYLTKFFISISSKLIPSSINPNNYLPFAIPA